MAAIGTNGQAVKPYETIEQVSSNSFKRHLGGLRSHLPVYSLMPFVTNSYTNPSIVVHSVSGECGEGSGLITATDDATGVYFTAPGDSVGASATLSANTATLAESNDADKWIEVYRDSDYNNDALGGEIHVDLAVPYHTVLAGDEVTAAGNWYGSLMLHVEAPLPVTNCKLYLATLGTQVTSDSTQLGASGSGTITTTGSLADWPTSGWAHIKDNGGTTREIVYYTSRTATALTVAADGRGLLGTSAAAGAVDDTVDAVPGVRIASEAQGSDGSIQSIASHTTAPTGVTWNAQLDATNGISVGSLDPRDNVGLWIHREVPTTYTGHHDHSVQVVLQFDYSGTTYTNTLRSRFAMANTSDAQYELFEGADADPDPTATPDTTSASLPFAHALTPPGAGTTVYKLLVRYVNKYGLSSVNLYNRRFDINNAGTDVTPSLTAPGNVTLTDTASAKLRLQAVYNPGVDTTPADTWRIYVTSDGTDPDPALDTPTEVTMLTRNFFTGDYLLDTTLGPYTFNDDVRVIVRSHIDGTGTESTDDTIVQINVGTGVVAPPVSLLSTWGFGVFSQDPVRETGSGDIENISETQHTANVRTYVHQARGMVEFWTVVSTVDTLIWRCVIDNAGTGRIFINDSLSLVNTAHSAAGTSGVIEVVSDTEIYLNVNSTRRCKITSTNIEAASFVIDGSIALDVPEALAHQETTASYFTVYNPSRARFEPYLKIDSSGVLTFAYPITQRDT